MLSALVREDNNYASLDLFWPPKLSGAASTGVGDRLGTPLGAVIFSSLRLLRSTRSLDLDDPSLVRHHKRGLFECRRPRSARWHAGGPAAHLLTPSKTEKTRSPATFRPSKTQNRSRLRREKAAARGCRIRWKEKNSPPPPPGGPKRNFSSGAYGPHRKNFARRECLFPPFF